MDLLSAVKEIKNRIGLDVGVYDVQPGKRFGDIVISIGCITDDDRDRIDKTILDPFEGYHIHLHSPIWGIGGLNPENKEKFEELLRIQEYVTSGTEKNKELELYQKKIIKEDVEKWNRMTQKQRNQWLKEYILKRRTIDPNFGNCADKYLI